MIDTRPWPSIIVYLFKDIQLGVITKQAILDFYNYVYPKDPRIRQYGLIAWNKLLWPCEAQS